MRAAARALALCAALALFPRPARAGGDGARPKKLAELDRKSAVPGPAKAARAQLDRKLAARIGRKPAPLVNLKNGWTDEILAVEAREQATVDQATWDEFLRCHYTNQARRMERRLVPVVLGAALHFHKDVVQIVSAYRAPKYNLMLRKKGHEVARQSQHTQGTAVDFRIPGVGTQALLDHVRSLHAGGVGFYPDSAFVHADTGPVRYWTGR